MSDQTEMTTRWVISQCSYCDERGYLPNGFRCSHESPEAVAERARRGAARARAALGQPERPTADEPYLPPDLAAESQARLELDKHRPAEQTEEQPA
jgi:hypothetical protein